VFKLNSKKIAGDAQKLKIDAAAPPKNPTQQQRSSIDSQKLTPGIFALNLSQKKVPLKDIEPGKSTGEPSKSVTLPDETKSKGTDVIVLASGKRADGNAETGHGGRPINHDQDKIVLHKTDRFSVSGLMGKHTELFSANGPAEVTGTAADLMNKSSKVLVIGYSSTGGGHTKRMLEPVTLALKNKTLKPGDTVVVLMPPRWKHDKDGSKVNTAMDYVGPGGIFAQAGLNVVMVQSDKAITGMYKKGGASDNVEILRGFVRAPMRDTSEIASSMARIDRPGPGRTAPFEGIKGYSAKEILNSIHTAVEDKSKVMVLSDMDPFLQKAAAFLRIKTRVEIGNHQGLFVGNSRDFLNQGERSGGKLPGKNLAYLAKASSARLYSALALIGYSKEINVVQDLPKTFEALKIDESHTMAKSRQIAVTHLLDNAKPISLKQKDPADPGIIVGPNIKDHKDVKNVTYLYVNDYNKDLVDHIRKQIAIEQKASPTTPKPYSSTLFVVCGGGGFKEGHTMAEDGVDRSTAKNIMHVAYAAGANGVTSAGFGTTSEYNYLAAFGYKGKFLVSPVEDQHEQESNAKNLVGMSANSSNPILSASGIKKLMKSLDDFVVAGSGRPIEGALMEPIIKACKNLDTNAGHAADLLKGGDIQRDASADATRAIIQYTTDHAPKEVRRMDKLLVPALDAIIFTKNGSLDSITVDVKVKKDEEVTTLPLREVIKLMKDPENIDNKRILTDLFKMEIKNDKVIEELKYHGNKLEEIMKPRKDFRSRLGIPIPPRKLAARHLEYLATEMRALGY
jgi:hypothetical protein